MSSSNRRARNAARRARAAVTAHPYAAAGVPVAFLAAPAGAVPNPGGSSLIDVVNHVASSPLLTVGAVVTAGGLAVAGLRYWNGTKWASTADHGFATRHQLQRAMGAGQMRSKKRRRELRPSLVNVPRREIRPTDLGFYTGTSVHAKVDTYAKIGDPLLVVAPPGAGKTEYLARNILDAQGAVVATSTKLEPIFDDIAELRSEKDRCTG
ncbi:hypothetical protein ACFQ0M_48825 [Kitasatospora aburaviensis]